MWYLRKKVHISWLIAVQCAGIIVGVILAQDFAQWFGSISWLIVGLSITGIIFWKRYRFLLPLLFVAGGVIGLWRGSIDQQQLRPYEKVIGHHVAIAGTVTEDPDTGKNSELILRLDRLHVEGHDLIGKVWVSTTDKATIKRGDTVMLRGKLAAGFGSFAASVYRAKIEKVQRPQPGDVAGQVRDQFADNVKEAVPEPQASLGLGYLVGQRRALPPELDKALVIAGLTHIVVASGYNLTILVRLARRLFVKVSKYLAALSAGGMIVAFIMITGMSPSMSRAGLVAGLSLLTWYYGRKFHPLVLLPFAAAVTLLINPSFGWNDLGWQLSFAAFVGVMIVAPLTQKYFFGDKKPGTIRQILGETIAAQLCTLPILVLAFGQFSNVAVFANLLILPLVPLAMLLTFIAGIGALIVPAFAVIIGIPANWLLQYMIEVASYSAALPWAQTTLQISAAAVVIFYVLLAFACVYMGWVTKTTLREVNIVE